MAKVTESLTMIAIHAAAKSMGYTELRVHQENAVKSFVAGNDMFVAIPTGGGKSFCFSLLPAVVVANWTVSGTGGTDGAALAFIVNGFQLFLMSVSRFSTHSLAACSCSSDLEHGRHSHEFLSTVLNENDELSATKLCKTASRWLFPGLLKQRWALGCVPHLHSTQSKHEVIMMLL